VSSESGSHFLAIDDTGFCCCSSLSSICIPSAVESRGDYCFVCCSNLQQVTFESVCRVTQLSGVLFARGASLSSIVIPSPIEVIGNVTNISVETPSRFLRTCVNDSFSLCPNLTNISFEYASRRLRNESSAFLSRTSLFVICPSFLVDFNRSD
jgi:hypothetical protein